MDKSFIKRIYIVGFSNKNIFFNKNVFIFNDLIINSINIREYSIAVSIKKSNKKMVE